jgi:thiamine biosynthesis lipoprotein
MSLLRQRFILCLSLMLLLCLLVGCAEPRPTLHRFEYAEVVMGVQARIILYEEDRNTARRSARAAFDRLHALEGVMSDYRPASELMRLCDRAGEGPIPVSADLFEVLRLAEVMARLSEGAFDVTAGPITHLWRTARRRGEPPEEATLEAARRLVDWRLVRLDATRQTVALERPGMQLDLGGIGKGYAADEAVALLRRRGAGRCLVDIGGDLALGDAPPGGRGWRVAIETLAVEAIDDKSAAEAPVAALANCGVATSGDRFQALELGEVRYSHILDPRTGLPLTDRRTVTVIAPDAAAADALASAVSVLPLRAALDLLNRLPDASGCIRLESGDRATVRCSESFGKHVGDALPGANLR